MLMDSSVVERFIRYVKIDTQSDHESTAYPSTAKQFDLGRLLVQELKELGLEDAAMDQFGYVMATLPGNITRQAPRIGFLAHMDTSPDASGKNVAPQFVADYDGGDIVLNAEKQIVLSPAVFPELKRYTGQRLITTDGTTLLGADDKAGVAEIMAALEYLKSHPQVQHGDICIGFTPDEETGHGVDFFDVKKFGAEFAYTVDGGGVGGIEYETFNAARARITIQGRSVHPGYAKGKMVNAGLVAMELNALLPADERPEYTSDYEGFFHLTGIQGSVEEASLNYIIRDHDRQKFEARKTLISHAVSFLNERYGGCLSIELSDTYYNLREKIEPVMHIVETAKKAIQAAGLTPVVTPVRGGTDGSRLSFMGLPTPNLFTGGQNAHGPYEYIPVLSMEKSVQVILNIIELYAQ
jgi:tripeptide aminopeptidase